MCKHIPLITLYYISALLNCVWVCHYHDPLQLKTTTIHIHNIFNVPDVVQKTYELIKNGRLLEAHR